MAGTRDRQSRKEQARVEQYAPSSFSQDKSKRSITGLRAMSSPPSAHLRLPPSRRSSQAQMAPEQSSSGRTSTDARRPQLYSSSSQHSHESYPSRLEVESAAKARSNTIGADGGQPTHLSTTSYQGRPVGAEGPRSAPTGGNQHGVFRGASMSTPIRASTSPDTGAPPRTNHYHPSQQRDYSSSPPSSSRLPPPPPQHYGYPHPSGSDHSHSSQSHSHSPLNPNQPQHPYAHSQHSRSQQSQKSQQLNERTSTSQMSHKSGRNGLGQTTCGVCQQAVLGQFVRAMGNVYHLDCFRCKDCSKIVASKFFPVDDTDGSYPLCERDYFARLDLICGKCDQALRGSYITACGEKFHVEHFTCSVCPTLFGPHDSYYEHGSQVYCHFHYSTRFAVKCVGCASAILKQFVEINRNQKDECWHPECYMIHKFWNVKLTSKLSTTPNGGSAGSSTVDITPIDEEATETPDSLKAKQQAMEIQVYQIWTVLSAFEESSAACISEMLRHVSTRQYMDAVIMAEKFILHVEILFAAIDDLEAQFALANAKGMSHAREAKMLCRKTVNFFSLLSHTYSDPEQRAGVTQDLLALVTGLAHYLKILIRIALTGSLKLEREHGNTQAISYFLGRLALLASDGGEPSTRRRGEMRRKDTERTQAAIKAAEGVPPANEVQKEVDPMDLLPVNPTGFTPSTSDIAYGYRSLAIEVTGQSILRGPSVNQIHLDHCTQCDLTVEEDCVRLGLFPRWHSSCVKCANCGKLAGAPIVKDDKSTTEDGRPKVSARRIPPKVDEFRFEADTSKIPVLPTLIVCVDHAGSASLTGFESVSRLEQYAFLLNVALRRLFVHLQEQGVVAESPPPLITAASESAAAYDRYRDSNEVKRMKSVNLDRKISANIRVPQRSTVVESPAGKIANSDGATSVRRASEREGAHRVPPPIHVDRSLVTGEDPSRPGLVRSPGSSTFPQFDAPRSASTVTPGSEAATPTIDVLRPAFARNNTSVRIINDAQQGPPGEEAEHEGREASPFKDSDAITLADIPQLMEAEQARVEHRAIPGHEGRPLISELSVVESLIMKHFALLLLQKSPLAHLVEIDDMLELVEVKKNQWWNKIFKGKEKKDVKKKGLFGVPLEILVERTGSDTQLGATSAQLRVPEFIDDIISAMKQMDMSVEGIFRKNGNIRRQKDLVEALDRDTTTVSLSDDNPVQLAALLKRFLRDLPDPLLTFRLHKLFCATQTIANADERKRCLHLLMCLLPRSNRDTVEVLFVFLKWVASFAHVDEETGSRMDLHNLAMVICPGILYARGSNAAMDESFSAIHAVQSLMEWQDDFYQVPAELMFVLNENVSSIFVNSIDLPPKEIFKHCTKYMTARQPQRVPGSASVAFVRDKLADSRISSYRSDGNLNATANGTVPMAGQSAPAAHPKPMTAGSRPTSWAQSPTEPMVTPQSPRRGPFQGQANGTGGSRTSSRGSAPSSPGPDERRSFQMERERSWTPTGAGASGP